MPYKSAGGGYTEMSEDNGMPRAALWKFLSARFSRYIDNKTSDINHRDVISDLAGRTILSGSYLSSIMLANLIALFGLLTNSVAVVIGAMLISPLMGPIFSLGLAFSLGDLALSRRAVRNIGISVGITVLVAALFTLLSPLKGVTHEILSRTRPNIYDLLIATFAGSAGALALCTRKNYLFTTTGVAVATAVIPPLSVVGYGVGTWQPGMAMGGFLLFFTNLVAIVISSNFVFYLLRFRGSLAEEPHYTARRRFQILGTVLVIISIPLVHTLVTDIRKVKLTGRVESILKKNLNRQQHSRITSVSIDGENGNTLVTASINTVKYVDSTRLKEVETELTEQLGRPVTLDLEQVIVRSGAVAPSAPLRAIIPEVAPPPETLAILRGKTVARLSEGCREIESFIAPYKVSDCSITFSDQNKPTGVTITISRDYPADSQEQRWLATALEKQLAEKIVLTVVTTPLLPPVRFTDKDEIDEDSRRSLGLLKRVIASVPAYRITMKTPAASRRNGTQTRQRVQKLKEYLVKEVGIPVARIASVSSATNAYRVEVIEQ